MPSQGCSSLRVTPRDSKQLTYPVTLSYMNQPTQAHPPTSLRSLAPALTTQGQVPDHKAQSFFPRVHRNYSNSPIPGDFPSGPVAKAPSFQCKGCRFDPWLGTVILRTLGQLSPHEAIKESPHTATKTYQSQNQKKMKTSQS